MMPDAPDHVRRVLMHSATITLCEGGREMLVFHASMAIDFEEVRERLVSRFGEDLAKRASVRAGFDPSHPLLSAQVASLLTSAIEGGMHAEERVDLVFERRVCP